MRFNISFKCYPGGQHTEASRALNFVSSFVCGETPHSGAGGDRAIHKFQRHQIADVIRPRRRSQRERTSFGDPRKFLR